MIIDCSYVNKCSRIIGKLKDDHQPVFDSIKLDFADQFAYFGSNKGFGRVKLPVQNYNGEKPLFFNLNSFLPIVSTFETLEYDGVKFKSGANNEFELAAFEDNGFDYPEFCSTPQSVSLGASVLNSLIKAERFSAESPNPIAIQGVFIKDGQIIATDTAHFYKENSDELKGYNVALPKNVLSVLSLLPSEITLNTDSEEGFIIATDSLELNFPITNSLQLPEVIGTPEFVAKYDHVDYLTLDKEVLLNLINFMQPFVQNHVSHKVILYITDTQLEFTAQTQGQFLSRKMDIETDGEIFSAKEPLEIHLNNQWLKTVVSSLEGDSLTLQVSKTLPTINFKSADSDKTNIVSVRLKAD